MGTRARPRPSQPSLLEQVRGLIDRTYDHRTGLGPLEPFLIGDEGFRRLVERDAPSRRVGADIHRAEAPGAQLLLRSEPGGQLRVSLYLPGHLIETLEHDPPARALHGGNVSAFATFVEEIDHLLLLAARVRCGPSLTLLELELHANVTKELVVRHFLARGAGVSSLPPEAVAWVRHHLFGKSEFNDADPVIRRRYRDAARYAVRYLARLDHLPASGRVSDLRRFSRMSHQQKLDLLREAA